MTERISSRSKIFASESMRCLHQSRKVDKLFIFVLCFGIFTQRFMSPVGGVSLALVVLWAYLAVLVLSSAITIAINRVIVAVFLVTLMGFSVLAWISFGEVSFKSFLLLFACWIPFLFKLKRNRVTLFNYIKSFRRALIIACLPGALFAIAQFGYQLFGGDFIDPLSKYFSDYLMSGYIISGQLDLPGFGPIYRSNGFYFLEPSFASQFFALAALATLGRQPVVSAIFIVAISTTGSGTGLIAFGVGLAVFMLSSTTQARIVAAASVAFLYILISNLGLTDWFTGRTHEFSSSGTSGDARFILPWKYVSESYENSFVPFLFGNGPGYSSIMKFESGEDVNFSIIPKLLIEYGTIFAIIFSIAVFYIITTNKHPRSLKTVVLTMTFLLSGVLLQPISILLLFCFTLAGDRTCRQCEKLAEPRPHTTS